MDHTSHTLKQTIKDSIPSVVIVGGGFGGIEVARSLRSAPVQVTIIDRRNYHLFQPLLYQVATATLSPADIADPIRSVVRDFDNCRVVLAKARGVDLKEKQLIFERVRVHYDWLVLAAGATHSYFGNDEWSTYAPGLKTLEDATEIRRRILLAFESAEYEGSAERRSAGLTFVIVGGGPTGVELAGAIREIASHSMPKDFRFIDTTTTKVILLQGGDRLLPSFHPDLSKKAKEDLEAIGVQVRLNSKVTEISKDGVKIGDEFIFSRSVFWAAGVRANRLSESLGVKTDSNGRVIVESDLSVPGYGEVFVIGDMAAVKSDGRDVPGVAQAAIQMGRFVGEIIASKVGKKPAKRRAFVYHDRGSMATIGKAMAVIELGWLRLDGFFAWIIWGVAHIFFLIGMRNRVGVMASWFWNWIFSTRDARLITGDARINIKEMRPGEVILESEALNHPDL